MLARPADAPAAPQPIHPGSYVFVARGLSGPFRGLSLECWVRPFDLKRLQGVLSQEDKTSDDGFALGCRCNYPNGSR